MSSDVNRNRSFNVNIRFSYSMRCIGKGQRSGQVFCAMLNLPPPSSKFVKSNSAILDSLKIVSLGSLLNAVREAKLLNNNNNNSSDIIVACGGSWQKRGHTSLNGMISVISIESGKVLDIKFFLFVHCVQIGKS